MRCLVTRRMRLGKPIEVDEVRAAPATLGDLRVYETKCVALGRNSRTASVQGRCKIEESELPLLYEAVLSWMAPNGFVLSGLEEEDGCLYAQSWLCRLQ